MISTLDRLAGQLRESVQEDPATGVFRCRRDIFTDPDLFALEMKHIFEGGWIYLAHESQVPEINDYFTTWIGRQPVVITRDKTRRAAWPGQRLRASRRHAVPAQTRQQGLIHLPLPWLDVQQRRQAAQGQGRQDRRLPGQLRLRRLP